MSLRPSCIRTTNLLASWYGNVVRIPAPLLDDGFPKPGEPFLFHLASVRKIMLPMRRISQCQRCRTVGLVRGGTGGYMGIRRCYTFLTFLFLFFATILRNQPPHWSPPSFSSLILLPHPPLSFSSLILLPHHLFRKHEHRRAQSKDCRPPRHQSKQDKPSATTFTRKPARPYVRIPP